MFANVFCTRVVGDWNHLSAEVVSAEGGDASKITIDEMKYELFPGTGELRCGLLQDRSSDENKCQQNFIK